MSFTVIPQPDKHHESVLVIAQLYRSGVLVSH